MKIQDEFIDSIKKSNASELSGEIVEFSVDQLLDEGLLKDIPWVGWIFKAKNIYTTISDQLFFAKIMSFLISIDETSEEEKLNFSKKVENDLKFKNKVGSTLLLALEKINDIEKPQLLAKVFTSFLKNYIDFNEFHLLTDSINTAFIDDLRKLARLGTKEGRYDRLDYERLYRSNLSEIQKNISFETQTGGSSINIDFKLSKVGERLKDILQDRIKQRAEQIERNKELW